MPTTKNIAPKQKESNTIDIQTIQDIVPKQKESDTKDIQTTKDIGAEPKLDTQKVIYKGYIYIIQTRESIRLQEDIYKIGRTGDISKRIDQYPKGSIVVISSQVLDIIKAEDELKANFKGSFIQAIEYGSEYFKGNISDMVSVFWQVTMNNSKVVNSELTRNVSVI
jgi:hypothetical protein